MCDLLLAGEVGVVVVDVVDVVVDGAHFQSLVDYASVRFR
jgi:hypothetical protein